MAEESKDPRILRGNYTFNPWGTITLATIRALNPFIQSLILTRRFDAATLLPKIAGHLAPVNKAVTLGLSPSMASLPPYQTLIVGLSAISSLKHIFWLSYIGKEEVKVGAGIGVGLFNNIMDTLNSIMSLWSITSPVESPYTDVGQLLKTPAVMVGSTLFLTGILLETLSESQRKWFKEKKENQGKAYTDGLFRLARHINYGGHILWRSGAAMVGGGFIWGALVAAFHFNDLAFGGVPNLDAYCIWGTMVAVQTGGEVQVDSRDLLNYNVGTLSVALR